MSLSFVSRSNFPLAFSRFLPRTVYTLRQFELSRAQLGGPAVDRSCNNFDPILFKRVYINANL